MALIRFRINQILVYFWLSLSYRSQDIEDNGIKSKPGLKPFLDNYKSVEETCIVVGFAETIILLSQAFNKKYVSIVVACIFENLTLTCIH